MLDYYQPYRDNHYSKAELTVYFYRASPERISFSLRNTSESSRLSNRYRIVKLTQYSRFMSSLKQRTTRNNRFYNPSRLLSMYESYRVQNPVFQPKPNLTVNKFISKRMNEITARREPNMDLCLGGVLKNNSRGKQIAIFP